MNIKFYISIVLVISSIGCSEYKDRKLLYSCTGVHYTNSVSDSFLPKDVKSKVHQELGLYIGDKSAEVFGQKFDICENGHTFIIFGNCGHKELVNFYSFDLVKNKLLEYDFLSQEYRKLNNFPLTGDALQGEYDCQSMKVN